MNGCGRGYKKSLEGFSEVKRTKKLFWLLIILSLLIGVSEFGFLVYKNLSGYGFSDTHNTYSQALWSMNLSAYWPMLRFLLALLLIHVLYAFVIFCIARFFLQIFPRLHWSLVGLVVLIVAYAEILLINSVFYPASLYALPELSGVAGLIIAIIGAICLIVFAVLGLVASSQHKKTTLILLILLIFAILLVVSMPRFTLTESERQRLAYHNAKPNIIIFMYCSMRADIFNTMPNFSKYAADSIWLPDAYVPVTRSGPSTYALLSGLYPANSGYFFNLSWSNPKVKFKNLLTQLLAKNGYQTILLTNINLFRRTDEKINWGFQVIDAVPHNVFSFFIPKISDIPLLNVLTNFSFSRWLFQYAYNNVEDTVHYRFTHFENRLKKLLRDKLERKPIFLLINDEVMHFPYSVPGENNSHSLASYLRIYAKSDESFPRYLNLLKKNHLLDNALVIVTADHGESFGANTPQDGPFLFFSHGNDAISQGEFNVPLVFHFYDNSQINKNKISGNVSTLDIMPTLLDLVGIPAPQLDGVSLLPVFQGKATVDPNQILFRQAELTFNITASANVDEQIRELAKAKLNTYQVNKLGEVSIKVDAADKAKLAIQYSVLLRNTLLVYSPDGYYILINRADKKYITISANGLDVVMNNLGADKLLEFGVSEAEFARMSSALKEYIIKAHQPSIPSA